MSAQSSTNDNEQILAAALSAILGKEILPESGVPQQNQQSVSKVSLFNQHLTSLAYGPVGISDPANSGTFLKLYITILATGTTISCEMERDALVDQLKQFVYAQADIPCNVQNLIHCGREIDEGHRLSEYDIQSLSTIFVVRLRACNANDLLVMESASWDSHYDYDFTNVDDHGTRFTRGGFAYRRPCGWNRHAIKVAGKYEDEVWLGSNNGPGEWPVSYHGTGHDQAKSIAQAGYDLTRHKHFTYGRGIYSSPDINVAKAYAKSFIVGEHEYLVVLQNRVNPTNLIILTYGGTGNDEYWVSRNDKDIRPYGVCIMKK